MTLETLRLPTGAALATSRRAHSLAWLLRECTSRISCSNPCFLSSLLLGRLEATYEIREDVVDVLKRVGAYLGDSDQVGWMHGAGRRGLGTGQGRG
jgi:hypothetical protein